MASEHPNGNPLKAPGAGELSCPARQARHHIPASAMLGDHLSPPAHRGRLVAACHNAAMGFDLVIRGATVVTPGHQEAVDIGIAGGRIAQLGGTMTGAEEFAAGGLLAIPGGSMRTRTWCTRGLATGSGSRSGWTTSGPGSRAAIAGGITTIGNMTYPVPDEEGTEETPSAAITREMAGAAPEAAGAGLQPPLRQHPPPLPEGEVGPRG